MRRRLLAIGALFAFGCCKTAMPCTIYVDSAKGADLNSGLSSSEPKQTLRAASAAVEQLEAPTRVTVCLSAGSVFRETLRLRHDGLRLAPAFVIWRSHGPGDSARITGGVDVVFEPLPQSDPARRVLPPNVADRLVVASLLAAEIDASQIFPQNGGFEWGCKQPFPAALSYGGVMQQVARWPNAVDGEFGGDFAYTAPVDPRHDYLPSTQGLLVGEAGVPWANWSDTAQLTAHGYWCAALCKRAFYDAFVNMPPSHCRWWDWSDQYVRVASIHGSNATLAKPYPPSNITSGARYYMLNSLDALDVVGEYYVK